MIKEIHRYIIYEHIDGTYALYDHRKSKLIKIAKAKAEEIIKLLNEIEEKPG